MGLRDVMDSTYGLHQLAHAHSALTTEDQLGGLDPKGMKEALTEAED